MNRSHVKLYIHFIFATKDRVNLLDCKHTREFNRYFNKIIRERECCLFSISIQPDHIHLLVGLNETYSISEFINEIKSISVKYIMEKEWCTEPFEWQEGYGAFSYSQSQIKKMNDFLYRQQEYHESVSSEKEFQEFRNRFRT